MRHLLLLALLLPFAVAANAQNGDAGIHHLNVPGLSTAGPYSHLVEAGGFVFLSGVIPVNYDSGEADTVSIGIATHRVLKNIRQVLQAAGLTLDDVVKATVYLRDMNDFQQMNEAWLMWFENEKPARSTVGVNDLPLHMPIEIEVIAWKGSGQ